MAGRPDRRTLNNVVRRFFAPRMLGLHVVAVLAVVATTLLGLWQLHAWETRRAAVTDTLVHRAPVPLDSVMTSDAAFPGQSVGQPVSVRGVWVPQDSLVVSGRVLGGRRGVWAVTPVAVCPQAPGAGAGSTPAGGCAKAPAVLVVRGWARSIGQIPDPPRGAVDLAGWLQPGDGSTSLDAHPRDKVLPALRIADALQHVHQDLYGGYVLARTTDPAATNGLLRVTPASLPAVSSFTAVRNLLYALEWWLFGGFAVFLWWRWCRDELSSTRGGGTTGEPTGTAPADQPGPVDGVACEAPAAESVGVPSSP